MGDFAFPPDHHLKKPSEFRTVFDRGAKRHTRAFILFRAGNPFDRPRLGVSVSRKIGGAVVRNRVKRLMREAFRTHWRSWELAGTDLVVIAKRGAEALDFHGVTQELSGAFASRRPR